MPVIAKHPITGVIHVILGDGESLTEQWNSEKVVVYRKDATTNRELQLVKAYGLLASPEELKKNAKQRCGWDALSNGGDPIHQHEDGTWWHFDELWSLENGPFETWDEAYSALAEYCAGLEMAANTAQEIAEEITDLSQDAIVKQLIEKLFPKGLSDDKNSGAGNSDGQVSDNRAGESSYRRHQKRKQAENVSGNNPVPPGRDSD